MSQATYVIGLGSNRPHPRHGRPDAILRAAAAALEQAGMCILAISRVRRSRAVGPGGRDFANAAILVASELAPIATLRLLKTTERAFGRRSGRRWGARVLDCDILAWSGGRARSLRLTVPHRELMLRAFALDPAAEVAPGLRPAGHGPTLRQAAARRRKPRAVDRGRASP